MTLRNVANNASSTLNAGIDADDVSLVVASAASFVGTDGNPLAAPFVVSIDDEIILVGSRSGASTTFGTLTRGHEGTTAAEHSAGATVEVRWTAGQVEDIHDQVVGGTTGELTDAQHGTRTLADAHAHADLSGVTADQHHAQAHDNADHSTNLVGETGVIAAMTEKPAPVSADLLVIEDSEAANALKKVQVGNLPSGTTTFTGLTDTPANYTSQAYNEVAVNGTPDALAFRSASKRVAIYAGADLTWTDMPAAETELRNQTHWRTLTDLVGYSQYRLIVTNRVAGAAAADLNVEYSTDNNSFADLNATGGEGEVGISSATVNVGAWVNMAAGAKAANIYLRIVGKDGDATADPTFNEIAIEFR